MPVPILIVGAFVAGGALIGKLSQMYGDSVVEDANRRREEMLGWLETAKSEFKDYKNLFLNRLITNSALLRSSIGQEIINPDVDRNALPKSLRDFFDSLLGEQSPIGPTLLEGELWQFSNNQKRAMVTASRVANSDPYMAGVAMGGTLASNGIDHAFQAKSYSKMLESEISEIITKVQNQAKSLIRQYETIQEEWDSIVVPLLMEKGTKSAESRKVLHAFADICETHARKMLES